MKKTVDPKGSKNLNIVSWNNERLERLDTLAGGCLQQKAHQSQAASTGIKSRNDPRGLISGLRLPQNSLNPPTSGRQVLPPHQRDCFGITQTLLSSCFIHMFKKVGL